MLSVNDLKINNYTIDFNIASGAIGIYARDQKLLEKLLLMIAGINYSNNVYYNKQSVFDNSNYFSKRIYMDFSRSYLSTLNVKTIDSVIYETYNKRIDQEKFKKINKELDIRGEVEITNHYQFTPAGQTLASLALLSSLNYEIAIINNPLANLKNINQVEYSLKTLKESHVILILGLHRLAFQLQHLDYLLVIDDFGRIRKFSESQTLLVLDNKLETNEYDNLKVFESSDKSRLIILDSLKKEDYKYLKQHNIAYASIHINDIENFL